MTFHVRKNCHKNEATEETFTRVSEINILVLKNQAFCAPNQAGFFNCEVAFSF